MTEFDYSTLNWVKGEIDVTLDQARQALEAYVENPEDETQLQFCVTYLHQVHGTLKMVELYGAVMLAEEMEKLGQALIGKTIAQKDDAYEILMRAILQLPNYLEHIQSGNRDVPVMLLPLLNDMRAICGQSLLSESAFFSPDLTAEAPEPEEGMQDVDPAAEAKRLRHAFQMGLVGWFRDRDVDKSLEQIRSVIHNMRRCINDEALAQTFWAAEGVVEGLIDKGIEATVSVKLLLGQVDRQLKELIDGEASEPSVDLVKNLLYYTATSSSGGETITALREGFQLEGLMAGSSTGESEESLGAVNTEVMATVSEAVKEDLSHIKDEVDLFVRAENPDPASLQPLSDALKKVADTLGMLGLGTQRNVVVEQAAVIQDLSEGKLEASDDTLMEMAGAFLFIESSLNELAQGGKTSEAQGESVLRSLKRLQGVEVEGDDDGAATLMQDSDQHDLLSAVIREAKADMARVKDAIVGFISAPWEHELLKEVPQLNRQVRGSMSILSLNHAAELLSAVNDYISKELIEKQDIPDQKTLDNLADAISSIEYYLEALEENRGDREAILRIAQQSLQHLGYTVGEPLAEESPSETAEEEAPVGEPEETAEALTEELTLEDVSELADEHVEELTLEAPVEEPQETPDTLTEELTLEDVSELADEHVEELTLEAPVEEPQETLEALTDELAEDSVEELTLEAPVEEPATESQPEPEPEAVLIEEEEDELDDEIREIFIEEADEEMSTLMEYFPRWKSNPDDEDALSTVRRSFHTLKGSGRMVGATDIGEYAWAFENMLNRVIDNTIQLNDDILQLMTEGLEALPGLIEHFKGGPEPIADTEALRERAQDISHGGTGKPSAATPARRTEGEEAPVIASQETLTSAQPTESQPAADVSEAEAPQQEAVEEEVSGIDPVLLEIFTKESSKHLDEVQNFIGVCEDQGDDCRITEELMRAVHTLHGSAHMAGITDIAEVSSLLEKYIKLVSENDAVVNDEITDLLKACSTRIRQRVSELADPDAPTDYKEGLISIINALYEQELNKQEAVAAEAAEEPATALPDDTESAAETGPAAFEFDVDPELLEIFLEEGAEILDASEVTLQNWVNDPDNKELVTQLQREIHTLKGGARMASIAPMGDLSHVLETMIIAVSEGRAPVSKAMFDIIQQAHDKLVVQLEHVQGHVAVPEERALISKIEALTAGKEIIEEEIVAEEIEIPPPPPVAEPEAEPVAELETVAEVDEEVAEVIEALPVEEEEPVEAIEIPAVETVAEKPAAKAAPGRIQHEQIRVRADLLDDLVNFAGEVSIYRSRIEQQVGTFAYNLTEMEQTIERLREQMRRFEIETEAQIMYRFDEAGVEYNQDFDPLEMDRFSNMQQLSRSLLETLNDLSSIQGLLDNQTREAETLLLQQSRINTELQEGLMRTRMVPFSTQLPRMRRLIRQTSTETKKKVDLQVSGEEAEVDRSVLDRIMPPLEHMLRNSIDHGVETPAQRKKAGKEETGRIHMGVSREGAEIVIRIIDDGAGINLDAIRKKAMERGLMKSDSDLTDKEVLRFILESGFSTAKKVTQLSGRGVGMDVVNSEIKQLGGTLQIETEEGKGTRFIIRLPLTLSVNKALLVHVGEETFAIPLSSVESVVRVTYDELKALHESDDPRYEFGGNSYRFMHLGSQLGMTEANLPVAGSKLPMLLVRAGDHRVALQIESLLGSREIVVKTVGPQISSVRAISGATILPDGSVALILDVGSLVYLDVAHLGVPAEAEPEEVKRVEKQITVMVVDDSITVRKVTTRLLERNGMQVVTAKDGVDAVATLQETIPDIFLLDIEMPRMDGYELATHIRNDEKLKNIPIIMITSRTGEKHRQRAMDIGVNQYLGKPYQEHDLLENINEILNESR
jgi:chemosensory pili system protein ChpA (sensor histidine kinase/response regulator)